MNPSNVFCSTLVVVCLLAGTTADAQTGSERITIGAHVSTLDVNDDERSTSVGIGGRGSFQLTRWLSADADFSFFPEDRAEFDLAGGLTPEFRTEYLRRRIALFAGPKAGIRADRFGVFAKARPGVTRLFNRGMSCVGDVCARALFPRTEYRNEFAIDVGGVFELYPTGRSVMRFDLGSTVIRHRSSGVPRCSDCTSRNLATSVGFGWRF